MKKILFAMDSLGVGGAEKSLITLLNILSNKNYKIELILIREEGLFLTQLPSSISILRNVNPLQFLGVSPKNISFYIKNGIPFLFKKIYRYQKAKKSHTLAIPQALWKFWEKDIKVLDTEYDVAISYLEGITNYFVIEKVNAKKKFLWIHNEYSKLKYNNFFDYSFFKKADNIVTISELCKQDLIKNFPELSNKFIVLENITNADKIKQLAEESINDNSMFTKVKGLKLLSIGRLAPQKAYDLALQAAYILKENNINFTWFIIGEGPMRKSLEELRKNLQLDKHIYFIGLQTNPYKYMKQADIIIQSSRFEGKSIAIDEAKVLCKPIVSTNYNTIKDLIQDKKNGIITNMTAEDLSNGIKELINNDKLRNTLIKNLKQEANNNINEINKYIQLIES